MPAGSRKRRQAPLLVGNRGGRRSRIRLETVGDRVVVARIGDKDMRYRAQTGWLIERTGGNRDVVTAFRHPEETRAANRTETSARLRRGLIPFQAIAACQLEICKRGFGVPGKMPVRPPALAAVAIDDIAQGSSHGILNATAQAAAAVNLAHGLIDTTNNRVVTSISVEVSPRIVGMWWSWPTLGDRLMMSAFGTK
jgi:hypothetical protein